jgi:hypothetical protein
MYPPHLGCPIPVLPQLLFNFCQESLFPVLAHIRDALPVHSRGSAVRAYSFPGLLQDVPPTDLIVK